MHPHHYPYQPYHHYHHPHAHEYLHYPKKHDHLKDRVLGAVEPFVQYGLKEAKCTSYPHALREVAAITYLMGMGYEPMKARQIVESWEVNETFYPGHRSY
jgi:hypothetical protein